VDHAAGGRNDGGGGARRRPAGGAVSDRLETGLGYWFVTSTDRHAPAKVRRFHEWLEQELAAPPIATPAGIA
jgi:hypothetical protein